MRIRSTGETAYFAASNSVSGFFSYYDELFNAARIQHVYAVKGGPGTGKSRFLRDVAACAEEHGWRSEYIYCSSDPNSLDAIILTGEHSECIALLDATAPHVYEPSCPGAREEIVNLGAFWNADLLTNRQTEIETLNHAKKLAYRRAYRYLSGLGEMSANRDAMVEPFIRLEKIRAFAERLMQNVPYGKGYSPSPALIHSIGMRGEVGFDTYFSDAKKLYLIEDYRGTAQYLMAKLGEIAVRLRLIVRISHDPVEPEKLDGLFLRESGIAFVVCKPEECEYPYKKIHMRRFADTVGMKRIRCSLNFAERMRRAMRMGALDELEKVSELHFRMEEIYMSAMNFEAKEYFTKQFCERLFCLKNG